MQSKKQSLLFYLFLVLITAAQGQSSGLKSKLYNSIDVMVGADYGFRLIQEEAVNSETAAAISNRDQFENYKFNHRFGINYYHGVSSNIALKAGLRISNPGFTILSVEQFNVEEDINTIEKKYLLKGLEYRYKYQFIEIPVGIKFVRTGVFCDPYVEFGVSTNYYIKTIVQEIADNGSSNSQSIEEKINKFNFAGFIGFGGNFRITDEVSGYTQLNARYQLNNLRIGDLEERILGFGLEVGFRYYL